jgi:hypothetical protein
MAHGLNRVRERNRPELERASFARGGAPRNKSDQAEG